MPVVRIPQFFCGMGDMFVRGSHYNESFYWGMNEQACRIPL